jgi:hypothetical protein
MGLAHKGQDDFVHLGGLDLGGRFVPALEWDVCGGHLASDDHMHSGRMNAGHLASDDHMHLGRMNAGYWWLDAAHCFDVLARISAFACSPHLVVT